MTINPDRDHRRTMRAFFAHYGYGPWTCVDCNQLIVQRGRSSHALNVHHDDGDVTNDSPTNLVPLHAACHLKNRHPITPDMSQQISRKLKGRPSPTRGMKFSDEMNAKKAQFGVTNGFYGKQHDEATRMKMRKSRRRVPCVDCGREYAVNWIKRHKVGGRCG